MPSFRRRAFVAAPTVLAAIALPAKADATVISQTMTDPLDDVRYLNPAQLKYPARGIDIERVTLSSDDSTPTKQIYVKVRLRNVIPKDPDAVQFLTFYWTSGDQSLFNMQADTQDPGVKGCAVCNLTVNPGEDFVAVRIPAYRLGGGKNLSVQVSASYYAENLQRSNDLTRKMPGKDY